MAGTAALAGLQAGDHVCVPYCGAETRIGIMEDFIRSALHDGDKVICCTVGDDPAAFAAGLAANDSGITEALSGGQLEICSAVHCYIATGRFDAERTAAECRGAVDRARREGHRGLRIIADMGWAGGAVPGAERLPWYEAEVNRIFAGGFARGACLYDRNRFSPTRLRRYIAAHPGTVEPDDPQPPQLRMRHTDDPRGLALTGEADIANRAALLAVLDGLRADLPGDDPLAIDLSGLTFADVGAAAALVRTTRRVPGVRLLGASRHLRELLELVRQADA